MLKAQPLLLIYGNIKLMNFIRRAKIMGIILSIFYGFVGLFILYIVIETSVRKGINSSIIGQFIEKKYGIKEDKKSFLDDDLDNDK